MSVLKGNAGTPWPGLDLRLPSSSHGEEPASGILWFHYPRHASRPSRVHECVLCLHHPECALASGETDRQSWRLGLTAAYLRRARPEVPAQPGAACNFADVQLSHLLLALVEEQEAGYPAGAQFGETIGTAIGLHLERHYSFAIPSMADVTPTPDWLPVVLGWIHHNWNQPVRAATLAALAGLSPCHFLRVFRKCVGLTPHQYVMQFRVEQAARLLRGSTLTLVEIALEAGFPSQSHFGAIFRRLTGQTPARYRLQHRGTIASAARTQDSIMQRSIPTDHSVPSGTEWKQDADARTGSASGRGNGQRR